MKILVIYIFYFPNRWWRDPSLSSMKKYLTSELFVSFVVCISCQTNTHEPMCLYILKNASYLCALYITCFRATKAKMSAYNRCIFVLRSTTTETYYHRLKTKSMQSLCRYFCLRNLYLINISSTITLAFLYYIYS